MVLALLSLNIKALCTYGCGGGLFAVFLAIVQGTLSSALQVEHKMQHSSMALVLSKLVTMLWMLVTVYVLFKGEALAKRPLIS